MTHITVSTYTVRAALTHAPKADDRKYLNGVHFDLGSGHVVATDGARIYVAQLGEGQWERGPSFTLGYRELGLALKGLGPKSTELDISTDDGVTVVAGSVKCTSISSDASYPDWKRVIPDTDANGVFVPVNPQYLVDAVEALALTTGRPSRTSADAMAACDVHYDDRGGPVVVTREGVGALVAIMPLRQLSGAAPPRGATVKAILTSTACAESMTA